MMFYILIILPTLFENYIYLYSIENGFDPLLIKSIIYVESRFNPAAINKKTLCVGLMGIQSNGTKEDIEKLKNPKTNIKLGCKILMHKIKTAGSLYEGLVRYGNSERYAKKVLKIHEILKNQKTANTTKIVPKQSKKK